MKRSELKRKSPLRSGSGLAKGGRPMNRGGPLERRAGLQARSTLKPGKRLAQVGAREQRHRPEDDVCRAEVKAEGCLCGCGATGQAVDWAHLDGRAGSRHKRQWFMGLHRSLHDWLDGHSGQGGGLAKKRLREFVNVTARRPTTDEFWHMVSQYGCPERRRSAAGQ